MRIAIIGAGFTGLSAAYYLCSKGFDVTVFEADSHPGGLAIGYQEKGWDWTLEKHYHHWFTNDKAVLDLAADIGYEVKIKRPITSSFVKEEIFQLDSPASLLKFPKLSVVDRIRTGVTLALLKYNPVWKPLENYKAESYLRSFMGKKAYETIWEPLMVNKLGQYAKDVSLSWFWARIYKRTPSLAYPAGGFLSFARALQKVVEKKGGKFFYDTPITKLENDGEKVLLKYQDKKESFDKVIVTLPSFLFAKISPTLPNEYLARLTKLKGIGAMNLILRLNDNFFKDNTYWLNMCDLSSPILAVVEHTNFMDKKHYNNEHLVYVGNYMPTSDPRYTMNDDQLLKLYDPWLKKINPDYKKSIISYKVFRAPFAQPIITPRYSKLIPPFITPLPNVFLANIEQVYPWDRGTNYAVELGKKVANLVE